jgi:hypothetical protein
MANDTEFGLASYFYSRDIGRIRRVAEALEHLAAGEKISGICFDRQSSYSIEISWPV